MTYLLASNDNGDLEGKLLLVVVESSSQALSLRATLGEVLLFIYISTAALRSHHFANLEHTLGSLKTPGVLKVANEANPRFCWALAATRSPLAPALVKETEDMMLVCGGGGGGEVRSGEGYHKRLRINKKENRERERLQSTTVEFFQSYRRRRKTPIKIFFRGAHDSLFTLSDKLLCR